MFNLRDEVFLDQQEMVSLYFGLDVSVISKLESQNVTQCSVYSVFCTVHSWAWGGGERWVACVECVYWAETKATCRP